MATPNNLHASVVTRLGVDGHPGGQQLPWGRAFPVGVVLVPTDGRRTKRLFPDSRFLEQLILKQPDCIRLSQLSGDGA